VKRRDFITLLSGGAAAAWPLAARAQPAMPMRRVAVINVRLETDPLGQSQFKAFLQGFEKLGWTEGRNVRIDVRWAGGSAERMRQIVTEFVALKPDVIVVSGSPALAALKRVTSTIPVVFAGIAEPVVQGFINSMARPGGNITGFTLGDFSTVGKSMEMLNAVAPALTHVGLMYNPETYGFYDTYLERFQREARWSMELTRVAVHVPEDTDAAVADVAARPGGGLAVLADAFNSVNQSKIRAALDRYRLPHIVPWRQYVAGGGLMSYGADLDDIFRLSANYVDRILKGANPAELLAQAPTKYELVINIKAAKALGLDVPPSLLAIADEVIE
jgi:putative tryptophan/tyrosine transport system substrate-binding protein